MPSSKNPKAFELWAAISHLLPWVPAFNANEAKLLLVASFISNIVTEPLISDEGESVPIPTFPDESIRILSVIELALPPVKNPILAFVPKADISNWSALTLKPYLCPVDGLSPYNNKEGKPVVPLWPEICNLERGSLIPIPTFPELSITIFGLDEALVLKLNELSLCEYPICPLNLSSPLTPSAK